MAEEAWRIFYSWQSDLDGKVNRSFIEQALEKAIKGLRQQALGLDFTLDRDTLGNPGAPDILQTILAKIDGAVAVVADVSLVTAAAAGDKRRRSPNPNVLFELGYAVARLGWDAVLPVHNLATGSIKDLPFDIRSHNVITYEMPSSDKEAQRKLLAGVLRSNLEEVVTKQADRRLSLEIVASSDGDLFRLGVQNNGRFPIEIVSLVVEANRHQLKAHPHPPVVRVETPGETLVVRLTRTDAPMAPGYPDSWRLPPFIAPGAREVFSYPVLFLAPQAQRTTLMKLRLFLADGTSVEEERTLGELLDSAVPRLETR